LSSFADGPFAVETLILSRSEVAALLEPHIVLTALREAFVAYDRVNTELAKRTIPSVRNVAAAVSEPNKGIFSRFAAKTKFD
jgi:ornithine cyclodeaminase/alanine dehydrogenase-like protein (mu-crystallin family)